MPAFAAMSVVDSASTPCSITMWSAPSRMALTLALLRSCWGVRRLLGVDIIVVFGGSCLRGRGRGQGRSGRDVLHVVEHVDHDLADEGTGLFGRAAGDA